MKKSLLVTSLLILLVMLTLSGGATPAQAAGTTWYVNPNLANDASCNSGGGYRCKTIQAAVDAAANGDTIMLLPGTHTGTVNIDTRSNLRLQGYGASKTLLQPTTTVAWNIWGYGTARQAAIRVVNSTGIVIDGVTLDLNNVKGNNFFGLVVANSTGTLSHNTIKNNQVSDASGGYYEIGMRIEARDAPYNSGNRAAFTISDNTFQDLGRVALNSHGWVNLTITRNTFKKTAADFGYGIELGSVAIGSITNNIFTGFNTAALSDGSTSAGLYIENCFTTAGNTFAVVSPAQVTKNVTVAFNEFYNNQVGMHLGNEFADYAGNVDIVVNFNNNYAHNNVYGGALIADEGRSLGSSVTVTGNGNRMMNNTGPGYDIYTPAGNGEIHVNLASETITGNNATGGYGGSGVLVEFVAPQGTSLFDVNITNSNISGNTPFGVENTTTFTVNATKNWWGSDAGPGAGGNNGKSGNVTTSPFARALATSTTASTHEIGETGILTTTVTVNGLYGAQLRVTHDSTILNWLSGSTIQVTAKNWWWDRVQENFIPVTAPVGRRLSGLNQGPAHVTGATLTGDAIAQWNYTCATPGTSALSYDTSTGALGTLLSDINGLDIPSALLGDSITCTTNTASVDGYIGLQGRLSGAVDPTGWVTATVMLNCASGGCVGYGPYVMTTDAAGHYQLVKTGAGTGIATGTYSASVSRRGYLGANKTANVTIAAGTNTINASAVPQVPTLLGGDANDDGTIDVTDLSTIGLAFGAAPGGGADTGADINGDNIVNIFDLVLGGGNFGLSTSTWP